ncbi:hypothetical protein [Methylobacterium sp. GC_Met_1]
MLDVIELPVAPALLCTARSAIKYIGLCMSDGVAWEPTSLPST